MSCEAKPKLTRFWDDWVDRFTREAPAYITPDTTLVNREVNRADVDTFDSRRKAAKKIWNHVLDTIDYRLSATWYTPDETITNGRGDCEDVTFLIASMLLAADIEGHEVVAGELTFPSGRVEEHTWNVVDGMIVDGTGFQEVVQNLEYCPIERWEIRW